MAKANGQSFSAAFKATRGVKETSGVTVVSENVKHTFTVNTFVADAEKATVADAVKMTGGEIKVSVPRIVGTEGLEVKRSKTFSADTLRSMVLDTRD